MPYVCAGCLANSVLANNHSSLPKHTTKAPKYGNDMLQAAWAGIFLLASKTLHPPTEPMTQSTSYF